MATKTKLPERAEPSPAEAALRRHLDRRGKIESEDDDKGLHDWIRNLNQPMEDCRTEFEKRIQLRIKSELGIVYRNEE